MSQLHPSKGPVAPDPEPPLQHLPWLLGAGPGGCSTATCEGCRGQFGPPTPCRAPRGGAATHLRVSHYTLTLRVPDLVLSSGRESRKSLSYRANPVSNWLKQFVSRCKRLFWDSHPAGPITPFINSVQTRCIVKGEAQKSPLFWRVSGGFHCLSSTRKPLNLIKSLIFTNTPCKSTCLDNAPSMQTVDFTLSLSTFGHFGC